MDGSASGSGAAVAGVKRKRPDPPSDAGLDAAGMMAGIAAPVSRGGGMGVSAAMPAIGGAASSAVALGVAAAGVPLRLEDIYSPLDAYQPGLLLSLTPEVYSAAVRIAVESDADFVAAEERKRIRDAEAAVKKADAAVEDALRTLTFAAGNPAAEKKLSDARAAAAKQRGELAKAMSNADGSQRRFMRDMVMRVTLFKDASDFNQRVAEEKGSDIVYVAPPTQQCPNCGNCDDTLFGSDYKSGDLTCMKCGVVVVEHAVHDGDWTRSFEGEENESTIGPRPDPLLSAGYNMRTGMALSKGVSKATFKKFRDVQSLIEMHRGGAGDGTTDHRTREGYKDQMKIKAFGRLDTVADKLRISDSTLRRAKTFFAAFRDNREHVQKFSEVVAACLIAAYEEAEHLRRQEAAVTGSAAGVGGSMAAAGRGVDAAAAGAASGGWKAEPATGGAGTSSRYASGLPGTIAASTTSAGSAGGGGLPAADAPRLVLARSGPAAWRTLGLKPGGGGESSSAGASSSNTGGGLAATGSDPTAGRAVGADGSRGGVGDKATEAFNAKARVLGYARDNFLDLGEAEEEEEDEESGGHGGGGVAAPLFASVVASTASSAAGGAALAAASSSSSSSSAAPSGAPAPKRFKPAFDDDDDGGNAADGVSPASSSGGAAAGKGAASADIFGLSVTADAAAATASNARIDEWMAQLAAAEGLNPDIEAREEYKAPS